MEHHFDIDIAKEYGIMEAVLINHFQFWIAKNKANGVNWHDGRHWTFNSQKAILELFPYISRQSFRTAIQHLTDRGVIMIGNYNETQYDRTNWYAFVDEDRWLGGNQPHHWLESTNAMVKTNQPIPDNNTDNIVLENNTPPIEEDNTLILTPYSPPISTRIAQEQFEAFRRAYKGTKRGEKTEFENFKKKYPKDYVEIASHILADYQAQERIRDANRKAGAFVPQPKNLQTYINQRCWEEEITLVTNQQQSSYATNTIGREAARLQTGLGFIKAGINSANTERSHT